MDTNHKLHLQFAAQEEPPKDAIGLLLPIPPATADQTQGEVRLPQQWRAERLVARESVQEALLASFSAAHAREPWTVVVQLRPGPLIDRHFQPRRTVTTAPQEDARALYNSMGLDRQRDPAQRLRSIIDCLADKFQYNHDTRNTSSLTCDLLTGNCLDINAALMKLLHLAEIEHSYYIGFFFPERQRQGGRHCWVTTRREGKLEHWDIAHHLKREISHVEAELNPIPGVRVAMSTGWDLAFPAGPVDVLAHHLASPRWVYADGNSQDCKVMVEIAEAKSATSVYRTQLA